MAASGELQPFIAWGNAHLQARLNRLHAIALLLENAVEIRDLAFRVRLRWERANKPRSKSSVTY